MKLQIEKPENWGNRMIAKDMATIEFEELFRQQEQSVISANKLVF